MYVSNFADIDAVIFDFQKSIFSTKVENKKNGSCHNYYRNNGGMVMEIKCSSMSEVAEVINWLPSNVAIEIVFKCDTEEDDEG